MNGLLIPVSMLEVKLGKSLTVGSADFQRAEQTIWEISVQARSAAEKTAADWPDHTSPDVPDQVKVIVAAAAYRAFKNPDRYVMNNVFQFTGQLDPNDFRGDIFLSAEREALESYRTTPGMWVQETTRYYGTGVERTQWVPAVGAGSKPFPISDW